MPANMCKMLNFSVAFLTLSVAGCGATTSGNQPPPPPQASNCSSLSLGQGASLGGFVPFPADSLWNADISSAPVDPNSAAVINFIGAGTSMHADFGAGQYLGSTIGVPYLVVGGQQPPVAINFTAYGSESDPGPMPVPVTAPIEGYPNPGSGDGHVLVLDNSNCFLYELSGSYVSGNSWNAGSGAVWDLLSNEQRPYTWTSADAAGLPIFVGLARYDEVARGSIDHALRFTAPCTSRSYVYPARHFASTCSGFYATSGHYHLYHYHATGSPPSLGWPAGVPGGPGTSLHGASRRPHRQEGGCASLFFFTALRTG